MGTKITDGKWYVSEEAPRQNEYGVYGIKIDTTSIDGIATVWGTKDGIDEETLATAKVFAASKDLLEALNELVCQLTGEQECEEELEKGLGITLAMKVRQAKQAINKATN